MTLIGSKKTVKFIVICEKDMATRCGAYPFMSVKETSKILETAGPNW